MREKLLERGAKQEDKENNDEWLEYKYEAMLADSKLRVVDPRFPGSKYDLGQVERHYGVQIASTKEKAVGEGLFAARHFEANVMVCPVVGRWVRKNLMTSPENKLKEYITMTGYYTILYYTILYYTILY